MDTHSEHHFSPPCVEVLHRNNGLYVAAETVVQQGSVERILNYAPVLHTQVNADELVNALKYLFSETDWQSPIPEAQYPEATGRVLRAARGDDEISPDFSFCTVQRTEDTFLWLSWVPIYKPYPHIFFEQGEIKVFALHEWHRLADACLDFLVQPGSKRPL